MKKNLQTIINDIETEMNARYTLSGYTPDGFEDSRQSILLGILAEMYEVEELAGKLTPERDTAYGKIAERLESSNSWN